MHLLLPFVVLPLPLPCTGFAVAAGAVRGTMAAWIRTRKATWRTCAFPRRLSGRLAPPSSTDLRLRCGPAPEPEQAALTCAVAPHFSRHTEKRRQAVAQCSVERQTFGAHAHAAAMHAALAPERAESLLAAESPKKT